MPLAQHLSDLDAKYLPVIQAKEDAIRVASEELAQIRHAYDAAQAQMVAYYTAQAELARIQAVLASGIPKV